MLKTTLKGLFYWEWWWVLSGAEWVTNPDLPQKSRGTRMRVYAALVVALVAAAGLVAAQMNG